MKEIKLTQGYVATVDDDDYEWLSQWKWRILKVPDRNTLYAVRTKDTRTTISMHRVVAGVTNSKIQIDHRDTNGLNNTRDNLRIATHGDNMHNRPAPRTNQSGFKGVSWHKGRMKWQAVIMMNHKNIHLGLFDDKNLAAQAYNKAANELHGEFARTDYRR